MKELNFVVYKEDPFFEKAVQVIEKNIGVGKDEILSKSRIKNIASARHILSHCLAKKGYTYQNIAELTNRDNHASVINSIRKAMIIYQKTPVYQGVFEQITGFQYDEKSAHIIHEKRVQVNPSDSDIVTLLRTEKQILLKKLTAIDLAINVFEQ